MKIDIKCCARCQGDHDEVEFYDLKNPSGDYNFYGICYETGQPILLKIVFE